MDAMNEMGSIADKMMEKLAHFD